MFLKTKLIVKLLLFLFCSNIIDDNENIFDNSGKQRYESAAAYIRRKNRERRERNQTISIMDEAWTRSDIFLF